MHSDDSTSAEIARLRRGPHPPTGLIEERRQRLELLRQLTLVDHGQRRSRSGSGFKLNRITYFAEPPKISRWTIVVNKCDLGGADLSGVLGALAAAAPVFAVSAATGEGVEAMLSTIPARQTLALLGSSGVGKSSLLNRIAGEQLAETSAVRARDDKGRHTTTRRSSFLARDWIVIDTPGLRELGLGATSKGLSRVFEDVESAASLCRFTDCRHAGEPGCAVVDQIDPERIEHYRALKREAESAELREDARAKKQAGRRHGRMIREAQAWRSMRRRGAG